MTSSPLVPASDKPVIQPGSRTLVILNPAAGQTDTEKVLRLLAGAMAVRGASFDVFQTAAAGDAQRAAKEAVAHGYRAVVAVGGDGTVGEVITGLAGTDVPVGIVAKGTANQVASNLGIPRDIEAAVEVAVNGLPAPIDLGQLDDGRYFALAAGAGWDAAVMATATRELKDRWGFAAYIYAGLQVGVKPPRHRYRIVADGREIKVRAAMVLLANMGQFMANTVPPVQVTVAPDVSYQDGKLDVCIFAPRNVGEVAGLLWRVLRGRFKGDERLAYFQASEVTVHADPPAITEVDGEPIGHTPLSARAVKGGVTVLIPHRPA
ncbi:MAG: diacylglycerol kinase family lipid kinase [Gemmatimonadetes bacterium]|nr:diacylglycerol kinase family lipid kinase [Gemmatimonadota bacterium]